jgi:hypothetical protein
VYYWHAGNFKWSCTKVSPVNAKSDWIYCLGTLASIVATLPKKWRKIKWLL